MFYQDDGAIPNTEVIEEYRKPMTYKEKVDVHRVEASMKQAMVDIGFNLKYVRENPQATKIAQLQFKQLVKQLDRTHAEFMEGMESDPSIDKQLLRQHYGKNYTEMLKLKRHGRDDSDDGLDEDCEVERDACGRKINLNPLDAFDKKRFKEGKLTFLGIKPRVDTNLQPTKEQRELADKRRVKESKMANKLKKIAKRQQRRPA